MVRRLWGDVLVLVRLFWGLHKVGRMQKRERGGEVFIEYIYRHL